MTVIQLDKPIVKEKQKLMQYLQVIDACFDDKVKNGLSRVAFEANLSRAKSILSDIKNKTENGQFPLFNFLQSNRDLDEVIKTAGDISMNFDELVVLGTGGSTLNPQSLVALTQPHEGIDKRVYFIDSVDPFTIESFIKQLDLESTAFLVTSKSGKTVETLAQFLVFLNALEKEEIENKGKHIYIISEAGDNPLRRIGKSIGATILNHEKNIGGRFSTFTNVGLIPALVAGVDIHALREGAKAAAEYFLNSENSEAAIGAALQLSFMDKNINTTVMMPYIDRLSSFATWYRQIWAESLGKEGKGSTPIKAVGALDQHSQLQLYLDGPKDKFFTLITLDTEGVGDKINAEFTGDAELAYLKGKRVGDINAALQQATAETLIKNDCPVRHIKIKKLDEKVLATLMVHFALETIITAGLLGLNAFDQPAVEEGKIKARDILSKRI